MFELAGVESGEEKIYTRSRGAAVTSREIGRAHFSNKLFNRFCIPFRTADIFRRPVTMLRAGVAPRLADLISGRFNDRGGHPLPQISVLGMAVYPRENNVQFKKSIRSGRSAI